MSGLPDGVVTFLFSDIEDSTRLVKALRDRYPGVLAEHRRLVRAAVAAHGGHEVDTAGDGFFVVFGGATQAVVCALEVQRALAAHQWPAGAAIRVRIGVHTGQAVRAAGGYTGVAVHRAARICAVARGGQVLISQATQAVVEDEEEELGFALVDAGEYRLKGLDRPVRLFQLAAPGLDPVPAAAGKVASAAAGGVRGFPAALTSFIGRDGPSAEVAGLLAEARLVTITGPGGTGKTRLAAEVARRVAGRYADGAWLAELAAVQDPAQVASVVAAALGVRDQPGVPAAQAVARVLARQQLLLVLDNCEHVIGAAAELCAGLLAAADDVRILATSREPLAVAGEARYRLAPLALPDLDDLAGAARAEAVALFADRARSADARFALDEQTGPAVARLVARLDGMPLAIELAAARVEALGVTGLLDRIDDRFALLAGGDRTAPSRQRSLAATVQWSYQLLEEDERRVFRAVSVFPGPFTLEAAEAVAGAGAGLVVLHLVDCSLLVPPRTGPDGRSRYGMLETLRAYGAGLLAEAGERDGTAAALAGYALGVAEDAAAGLQTSYRGGGRGPAAGCRGRHHGPGAGLGHGPRRGDGAAAGGRAGLVVVAARAADRPVPAAARARRTRGAGQRRMVRHPKFPGRGRVVRGRPARGAGPSHRGPRCRRGPGPVPGAGRRPDRPVDDPLEHRPARRGDRGRPPRAGYGPGPGLPGRRGEGLAGARRRRLPQRRH